MTNKSKLALIFGAALGLPAICGPVMAQSGGNELNPTGQQPGMAQDEDGTSFVVEHPRSPSGILYPIPFEIPAPKQTGGGWLYSGFVEFGYLGTTGDDAVAKFSEYGDFDNSVIAPSFGFSFEKPSDALYINGRAGSLGRDDQYYELEVGKYGAFKFTGFFQSIPHVFANNAKSIWDGAGTGNLTLRGGLTPGLNSADDVRAALGNIDQTTLKVTREKAGFAISATPLKHLEIYARASSEWRDGAQAFGGVFAYPTLGQVMETIEPVDYLTYDVETGLRHAGETYQVNLAYKGSFFRNNIDSLTWENPGLSPFTPGFVAERGRFALNPDNDYHNLSADFAAILPMWHGRFTASASYSKMRQNDDLLPQTVNTGIGGGANPVDFADWNTVAGLSQTTANAQIDAIMFQAKLSLAPTAKLRLRAKIRYYDQDNKTDYESFNPLTGEYGYIALDGGLAGVFGFEKGLFNPDQPGSRIHHRSVPFEKDTLSFTLGADYSLARRTKLGVTFEHENITRPYRERVDTHEDSIKIQLTNRDLKWATARLSYEYVNRGGDAYNFNPYEPFYSSSLPGFIPQFADGNAPHTLSALRKFDLADSDKHMVNARINFVARDDMDLFVSGQFLDEDFDADFGLTSSRALSFNAEWTYHISNSANVYAFYSYQRHQRSVANINDAGAVGTNPDPGGPVFPLENAWAEDVDEKNNVFGFGLYKSFNRVTLKSDYLHTRSRSQFRYSFASPAAFFNVFTLAEVGDGFPDQTYRSHRLETSLRFAATETIAVRFLHRFEQIDIADFHYDGFDDQVIGSLLFLGAVPRSFTVHVLGAFVQVGF